MAKILFLGGPSGSGKSSFASEYLTSLGWIHLEIDQHPKDGITENKLRAEWHDFYATHNPTSLHAELLRRADRSPGIVLSFPGNLVFSPDHIRAAGNHFCIAYLYGHPVHCLRSFLQREEQSGRRLPASHWDDNNRNVFGSLSCSIQHSFLINAFNPDGSRRDPAAIYQDIFPCST